ncbi:MAG: GGDEF domain-containing protein [bacterium]|nr:GGDEF domain-containing protein [bacterium]
MSTGAGAVLELLGSKPKGWELEFRQFCLRDIREALLLMEERANIDALTGALNQGAIMEAAKRLLGRAHKNQTSVLMLDVDHFKKVNDTHGHEAGNAVLVELVQLVRDTIRSGYMLGRNGGDEFMVLLPETSCADAGQIGERIRKKAEERFRALGATVSIGVACTDEKLPDPKPLIEKADRALYTAKEAGRNRVFVA